MVPQMSVTPATAEYFLNKQVFKLYSQSHAWRSACPQALTPCFRPLGLHIQTRHPYGCGAMQRRPRGRCQLTMSAVAIRLAPPMDHIGTRSGFQFGEEEDEGFRSRQDRFMESGLVAVGIRRLNELLEDDIDRRNKKENVSSQ